MATYYFKPREAIGSAVANTQQAIEAFLSGESVSLASDEPKEEYPGALTMPQSITTPVESRVIRDWLKAHVGRWAELEWRRNKDKSITLRYFTANTAKHLDRKTLLAVFHDDGSVVFKDEFSE